MKHLPVGLTGEKAIAIRLSEATYQRLRDLARADARPPGNLARKFVLDGIARADAEWGDGAEATT